MHTMSKRAFMDRASILFDYTNSFTFSSGHFPIYVHCFLFPFNVLLLYFGAFCGWSSHPCLHSVTFTNGFVLTFISYCLRLMHALKRYGIVKGGEYMQCVFITVCNFRFQLSLSLSMSSTKHFTSPWLVVTSHFSGWMSK